MTKRIVFYAVGVLVACAIGVACDPVAAAQMSTLRLKPTVRVNTSVVFLQDIVESVPESAIGRLKIFSSPRWGSSRTYTRDEVQRRLLTLAPQRFTLAGSPTVEIRSAGGDRSSEVRQALESQLDARPRVDGGVEYDVSFPNKPLYLPEGPLKVEASLPERRYGTGVIRCQIWVKGRKVKAASYSCRINRKALLPVASHNIEIGDTLRSRDFTWIEQSVDGRTAGHLSSDAPPEAFRVKRRIREGTVILRDQLQQHPIVLKGQTVDLVIKRSAVRVAALAMAMEDGWAGNRIRVKNLVTNRYVYGRVADKGVVIYE